MGKLPFRQVHLDFHTSELIENIGGKFDKKQFQDMLKVGHVNSITIFSKCHHGWAYHDTEANKKHPHLKFNLLDEMIAACKEIGVQTPVYISAGLDEKIAREHPEWLIRNKDESIGWSSSFMQPGYQLFCFNTPYLDILIKQCEEVAKKYDVEGIFLDIVSPRNCYCQYCIKSMREQGINVFDEKAVWEFGLSVYENYFTKIDEAIHKINPNLRIFHNGSHIERGNRKFADANTHHLELESLPTGGWGYDHFPLSARYVHGLGKEFLGMTGKFHLSWGEFGGFKHPNALKYEVALSIANGAKCSIGDQMHPLGFLDKGTYELIGAAYEEVEAVEQYCDDVTSVADIALFSDTCYIRKYHGSDEFSTGASRMMLEGKYLYDVIDCDYDFNNYKVLILPDRVKIDNALKVKIDAFLANGGKILATGQSGLFSGSEEDNNFCFDFGADYIGKAKFKPSYFRPFFKPGDLFESVYVFYGESTDITARKSAKTYGAKLNPYFNRETFSFSSHQHTPNEIEDAGIGMTEGKDGIYICWNVFEDYATKGSLILKETVKHALDILLGTNKTLKTNLPAQGVVTLMRQKDKNRYVNHLLYATPTKRGKGVEVIEDLIPIYNTEVTLKLDEKIKKAYIAKTGEEIKFQQNGDEISYTLDKFICGAVVVLEY